MKIGPDPEAAVCWGTLTVYDMPFWSGGLNDWKCAETMEVKGSNNGTSLWKLSSCNILCRVWNWRQCSTCDNVIKWRNISSIVIVWEIDASSFLNYGRVHEASFIAVQRLEIPRYLGTSMDIVIMAEAQIFLPFTWHFRSQEISTRNEVCRVSDLSWIFCWESNVYLFNLRTGNEAVHLKWSRWALDYQALIFKFPERDPELPDWNTRTASLGTSDPSYWLPTHPEELLILGSSSREVCETPISSLPMHLTPFIEKEKEILELLGYPCDYPVSIYHSGYLGQFRSKHIIRGPLGRIHLETPVSFPFGYSNCLM